MLEAAAIVLIAEVIAFLILAYFAWTAPEGWEDEHGFHLGRKDEE